MFSLFKRECGLFCLAGLFGRGKTETRNYLVFSLAEMIRSKNGTDFYPTAAVKVSFRSKEADLL